MLLRGDVMKKMGPKLLVCLGLIGFMAVTQVWAQPGAGMGGGRGLGWGAQDTYGRMFNSKTVEKLTGEVVGVETFTPGKGMSSGTHITVKTDKADYSGPFRAELVSPGTGAHLGCAGQGDNNRFAHHLPGETRHHRQRGGQGRPGLEPAGRHWYAALGRSGKTLTMSPNLL